ncbi:MAG: 50S ribosomal protein L32 [Bifidobacteriaceae bacterium]|nr:50S ribosomal protein L32 [Bifidobacteriaceae bacterium]
MAVPKRRTSRANTRTRRSQWKTSAPALTQCPNCGEATRPHTACPHCGVYKGRYYQAADRSQFEA